MCIMKNFVNEMKNRKSVLYFNQNTNCNKYPSGKCPFGEILVWGNVCREYVCQGIVHQTSVLRKVSVGAISIGELLR